MSILHKKAMTYFYAPNFGRVEGAYFALGLSLCVSICQAVLASVQNLLTCSIWIPHQKIIDTYFFVWIISLRGVMPLLKGHNDILYSRYLKTFNSYELQTWSANRE